MKIIISSMTSHNDRKLIRVICALNLWSYIYSGKFIVISSLKLVLRYMKWICGIYVYMAEAICYSKSLWREWLSIGLDPRSGCPLKQPHLSQAVFILRGFGPNFLFSSFFLSFFLFFCFFVFLFFFCFCFIFLFASFVTEMDADWKTEKTICYYMRTICYS